MSTISDAPRSLPALPPELIELIIQFGAEETEDSIYPRFCMNAALVCRSWTDSALRQLYARLSFDNEYRSMMSLVVPLIQSPNLGLYPIREIAWCQERACDCQDLIYFFKLLFERTRGLEKLTHIELCFPIRGQPAPELYLPDLLRFTPVLRKLCTDDVKIRFSPSWKNNQYKPPPSLPNLELDMTCDESVLLTTEWVPELDRLHKLSTNGIFAEFKKFEPHERLGLTERLQWLHLEYLGSGISYFRQKTTFNFPRLLGIHLDFTDTEFRPCRFDFFDDWKTPALVTISSYAPPTMKVFSLLARWLDSPAFRTVTTWNILDQTPLDMEDSDCIGFLKSCDARNVKVIVKYWEDELKE